MRKLNPSCKAKKVTAKRVKLPYPCLPRSVISRCRDVRSYRLMSSRLSKKAAKHVPYRRDRECADLAQTTETQTTSQAFVR